MRSVFFHGLLFLPFFTFAQKVDTSFNLPSVEVTAVQHERESDRSAIWRPEIDNIPRGMSLDQLLQQQALAFIRSYGAGNLATISLRGATSSQTSMMWNGVPINNAMLGLADVSNVPVDGFDQLALDFGSDAIRYGSSSIGGNIRMGNRLSYKKRTHYRSQFSIGSFGAMQGHFRADWGNHKWSQSTRLGTISSQNNFFVEAINEKQKNSSVKRNYLMHSTGLRLGSTTEIKLDYWRQQANRQVPPTLRQNASEAYQKDAADRVALTVNHLLGSWILQGKAAWMKEQLDYFDSQIRLSSPTSIETNFARVSARKAAGSWNWQFGIEARRHRAKANGYSENRVVQRYQAAYGQVSYSLRNWQIQASARQAHFNGKWIPLVPGLEIEWGSQEKLMLYSSLSGHYRIPSLNELYWRPGGNSDLIPEQGWSAELGGTKRIFEKGEWSSSLKANGFYRRLDHWLQWSLPEGGSFFQALNIDEVFSYGFEAHWKTAFTTDKWSAALNLSYTKVRSFSEEALIIPKRESRQQLHYLPENRGIIRLDLSHLNWKISYAHQYQTAMDGFNKRIEGYHLGDWMLSNRFQLTSGHEFKLQLECRNAWNKNYEVVEFRPMPGRNYFSTIIYVFKN